MRLITVANETLEEFVERINRLSDEELSEIGQPRESYLTMANNCAKIKDSISYSELKLLFYLRNGRIGELMKFLKAAELSYEANCAFAELKTNDREMN